jgi:hypothetical protein
MSLFRIAECCNKTKRSFASVQSCSGSRIIGSIGSMSSIVLGNEETHEPMLYPMNLVIEYWSS